ncbi:MAG: SpoIIE family protein phosphatase [Nocardioidaceae bacterium]
MSPREHHAGEPVVAEDVAWIRVEDDTAPGAVRRRAIELAERMGFDETRTGQVAIVSTELSTNLAKHARDGEVVLRLLRRGEVGGVEIVALDRGPGMRDVRALFSDGTSTTGTLGIGLGALRRLSSHHDVHSVPGHGTVVTASFWPGEAGPEGPTAGLTRTLAGETECGDAYAVRRTPDGWLLLSVDGLGHGSLAARAATAATRIFRDSAAVSPGALLGELHRGLSGTRGAAAAIGHLDLVHGRLTYSATGNIAGRLVTAGRHRGLVTHPGIVGHNARAARETTYDLEPGSWVVMHSDGLTEKWDIGDYPGLLDHSPLVVAATLLREAGVHRDDASVLVAKAVGS